MSTIKRFEEIQAWQTARELTRQVYASSREGQFARDFGLRDQIRRSSVSVMDNIAEGYESRTSTQFLHYLGQAKASCGELRSQLYVALDAGYIEQARFDELFSRAEHCSRQIARFMDYLGNQDTPRIRELEALYDVGLLEQEGDVV
jgi:four helix bundle protein